MDDVTRTSCPATWDGLTCWSDTSPGEIAKKSCEKHIYFLQFEPHCQGYASKQCNDNGTWLTKGGNEWTNYKGCKPFDVSSY